MRGDKKRAELDARFSLLREETIRALAYGLTLTEEKLVEMFRHE